MSILAIALTIVLIGLVVWFLTPSGKAEIVKVEDAAKADVQSAVADVRKRLP